MMYGAMDQIESSGEYGGYSHEFIRNKEYDADEFDDLLFDIVEEYAEKIKQYEEQIYRFRFSFKLLEEETGKYEVVVEWVVTMPNNPFAEMLDPSLD